MKVKLAFWVLYHVRESARLQKLRNCPSRGVFILIGDSPQAKSTDVDKLRISMFQMLLYNISVTLVLLMSRFFITQESLMHICIKICIFEFLCCLILYAELVDTSIRVSLEFKVFDIVVFQLVETGGSFLSVNQKAIF